MGEQRYRIHNLSLIILYKVYVHHIDGDENRPLPLREIRGLFSEPLPLNLIDASIDWMRNHISRDYLRRVGTKDAYQFSIAPEGIKFVEMELLRKTSPIHHFEQNGENSLVRVAGLNSPFMTEEERRTLDDDWHPIEIDRDDPVYLDAEKALDEAITTIEQDNEFAANMPEERAGILQTMRDGLDWLKTKTPTKQQLKTLLLSPLNWLIANFSKTVTAEVAKKAAEKLWALINSLT
jgi:hypothetical protein